MKPRDDLESLRRDAEEAADGAPRFIAQNRPGDAARNGSRPRRRDGDGDAFWDYKPYSPGDPVAAVDWRRTARADKTYIRVREAVSALRLWIWRDASASMDFASGADVTKGRRAAVLGLAAALAARRAGEDFRSLDQRPAPTPPRNSLAHITDALHNGDPQGEIPNVRLPGSGRAVAMIIGDFLNNPLNNPDALGRRLRQLDADGGVIVQVLDPHEAAPPKTRKWRGRITLIDPENPRKHVPLADADAAWNDYAVALNLHERSLQKAALGAGFGFVQHLTSAPASEGLRDALDALDA